MITQSERITSVVVRKLHNLLYPGSSVDKNLACTKMTGTNRCMSGIITICRHISTACRQWSVQQVFFGGEGGAGPAG